MLFLPFLTSVIQTISAQVSGSLGALDNHVNMRLDMNMMKGFGA